MTSSAFISGAEVAFFSLTHKQISQCRNTEDLSAKSIVLLLKDSRRLLATILILNNLINIAFITVSTYLLWRIFGKSQVEGFILLVYTTLSTACIVLFAEVIPKMYANYYNLTFARKMSRFLVVASKMLRPMSSLLLWIGDLFGKETPAQQYTLSEDKFDKALELTTERGIPEEEKKILRGIMNFGQLTVKQVMQPRTDITAIERSENFHQLMDLVNKSGYSRLPVYRDTIDSIEGVLHVKDLLPHLEKEDDFHWQTLIRKCLFIPEYKKIDLLLLEFQEKRMHMAVVVDEYGGTAGLITMEDIIEEIIGDITDEFDRTKLLYRKVDEQSYIFEGKISLTDLCKVIDEDITVFDEVKGESESLAGLLLELHGRLPQVNERIQYRNFEFTVMAVDTRKIKKVRLDMQSNTPQKTDHSEEES